ncbi:alpha/beta fold hydrolase [Glacieibacterium megasporae]|uniref:alpha/beta fold hydrolase n=1 Tax=Glacieibacterium megasporae TaxID=2835787 RepID=UPI001C1E6958|nr:alpha/beta hydrolase [Polymorphobacter megasporae]UAJ10160.1 alpha/beta hydrolase [Polymorphobacter megasporae]
MQYKFRETAVGTVATIESFAAGPAAPLVHFAHATGMCAALYRPLFDRLTPHVNVVASDSRGHGSTPLEADPADMTSWATYADDLAALLAVLPVPPVLILAGHSMGATVSMECAARMPGTVRAVVMAEPAFVAFAAAADWNPARPGGNPLAEQALRRRAVWPSRYAIRAAYDGRGVFASWPDGALDAYLDGGLRDRDDGQVELACAPAWESATFAAVSPRLEAAVTGWRGGLTVLHGTERSTVNPTDAAAIAALPGVTVTRFDGVDHFLPLHRTAELADAILGFA